MAEGAMVEPLPVGMHAATKARTKPSDINHDLHVDLIDLSLLATNFGTSSAPISALASSVCLLALLTCLKIHHPP